ncbi:MULTISPECIES: hypothetical protein [Pseudomonas syringae group]|uniref:hypothetical protein n=1 Tax=Pseudomonas syringae group TaxID=136849 RepID=UPI000EFEBA36|nr:MULTISPECIES: hypothetical protein [Pseudomonas syringae group]MDH4602447.1 hypothetical protein [Pseudomonas syringae pv. papulans]
MNEAQNVIKNVDPEPQTEVSGDPLPGQPPKRKILGRTRRVARFVLAIDAWKRQAQILNGRLRFPLLRRVLSQEIRRRSEHILLSELEQQTLENSKLGHILILVVMVPCFLWALILITRGLAAAIKFDVVFNSWLITGIPFALFTGAKLFMSYLSYKAISNEILLRSAAVDQLEKKA